MLFFMDMSDTEIGEEMNLAVKNMTQIIQCSSILDHSQKGDYNRYIMLKELRIKCK